ncbi:MAG: hypothetical protein ACRDMX_00160 [Solirubrobacteraceae bacterium]
MRTRESDTPATGGRRGLKAIALVVGAGVMAIVIALLSHVPVDVVAIAVAAVLSLSAPLTPLVVAAIRRYRKPQPLRGDWWERFEREFSEYAASKAHPDTPPRRNVERRPRRNIERRSPGHDPQRP